MKGPGVCAVRGLAGQALSSAEEEADLFYAFIYEMLTELIQN